jgi:hypothetical protein
MWWCGETRLPDTGGVLDQDAGLWYRMQTLGGFYRLVQRLGRSKGDQIHSLTPSELLTWKYLIREGLW